MNKCSSTYERALYLRREGKNTSVLRYDEAIFLKFSERNLIKVQTILLPVATDLTDFLVHNLPRKPNSPTGEYIYRTFGTNFVRDLKHIRL